MAKTVVIYHSGYGHTQRVPQFVAEGANAELIAIDAAGNRPFGEELGGALPIPRLPRLGAVVVIGVVFHRRAQRVVEVPEIGRGDRVPARADLRLPPLLRHGDAAADHLVDVGQREGLSLIHL